MITPDDVRGSHPTLESAVLSGTGGRTLADSAGKVMFLMDNASKRDLYRAGRPSLEGRVLFTNATPGSPDAALVEMNDPVGNTDEIQQLVRDGYVVRTRADADTVQARTGDTTMRDAAPQRGAVGQHRLPDRRQLDVDGLLRADPRRRPESLQPGEHRPRCANELLELFRTGRR